MSVSINGVSLFLLPYWDIFLQIEIFAILKFPPYWFLCWKSAILKCPLIEMSAILDRRPYCFWSYCNLFSKWYLGCLVMLLLTITVNLSRSDNDFTWIAYFIISIVWTSSFKLVLSMPWCSSIYHLGIVISFGIWFDGKPPWWLWDIHIQSWCLLQVPAGRLWSVEWCGSGHD